MMKQYIIIGNSAAGIAAAEAIRRADREATITIVSDEPYPTYCRCLITNFLSGDIKESGALYRDEAFFKENNIGVLLNNKVIELRAKKNTVVVEEGNGAEEKKKKQLTYDYLVLANGASPKFPDIKGVQKHGVFGFRTMDDAKKILERLPVTRTACVLGGGLIGLKAAYALHKRGVEVKVIVRSNRVLSQVLDDDAAVLFGQRIQENGIEVLTGTDVTEIIGNGDVKAVKLDKGKVIGCSIVIVGKGVQPNIELVKETGINVGEGIIVDEYMGTAIPNIFAAGDVTETHDPALDENVVNALWPNAVEQGKIAGANSAGGHIQYAGSMGMNSVEFFNLPVISMGVTRVKEGQGYEQLVRKGGASYKKLIVKDKRLVGGIFVGELTNSGVYLELIKRKIDVSSIIDQLLDLTFSYANVIDFIGKDDSTYSQDDKK